MFEIRVEGQLTDQWSDWFSGLAIHYDSDGKTTLSGTLADQAALIGVLNKIQALNLIVVSVKRSNPADMAGSGGPPSNHQEALQK